MCLRRSGCACRLPSQIVRKAAHIHRSEFLMAYMLFIVHPTKQRNDRTDQEGQVLYERMSNYADDLRERGLLLACESLKSTRDAVRVQMRRGQPRLLDG